MELKGEETIPLGKTVVWSSLNDPEVLKASIPGCELIEATAEGYRMVMLAAIGPVKARFNGKLTLTDVSAPDSYTIIFEGSGGVAGFGKGRAGVKLRSVDDGTTLLTYTATAQVGGKIAQVGSRLIDGVASKMAAEFFARFKERIAPPPQAPAFSATEDIAAPKATKGARRGFWGMLAFWRWWPRHSRG